MIYIYKAIKKPIKKKHQTYYKSKSVRKQGDID